MRRLTVVPLVSEVLHRREREGGGGASKPSSLDRVAAWLLPNPVETDQIACGY